MSSPVNQLIEEQRINTIVQHTNQNQLMQIVAGEVDTNLATINQNNREGNQEIPFEAPDNIDKAAVTSMTAEAFRNCTVIDTLAFYGYENLKTIELPASITKIKQFAFGNLPKLKEVIIPDGEIEIDSYAFFSCKNLKKVRLPEGLTEIKTGTFSDCQKLSRIRIPDSVTKIEDFAFFACGKSFKATNVPQNATIAPMAFPNGKKSYSQKREKQLGCGLKKGINDGIIIKPTIIENNLNFNDFYNDDLGDNVNEPVLAAVEPATAVVEPIPTVIESVPDVVEPTLAAVEPAYIEDNHAIPNVVSNNQNEVVAGSSSPEFDIANELDNLYIVAGCNEHWMLNANRGNVVDNTRVEADKNLLNRLENLYMIDALNISTPYIYNQSGLTEKFRLYDGNRSEITIENENGVARIKHNVDKGEGSSDMMRILYPSSAGALAAEGGYTEAFKKDCAPTPELMGEIVAHLYKYRKDKSISLRDKFGNGDADATILKNISAYISAKDEINPRTGEITKGAVEKRNEIRDNLAGDRLKNQSVLAKLEETFKNKPRNVAALNDLKSIPQDIMDIGDDQNRDTQTKYNDIMALVEEKETALKEKKITKKEFANYGIVKGKLELKIEDADIQAIERALGLKVDIKGGRKFSEPINAYKDKIKADEKREESIKRIFPKVGSILMEFPSLQFIGKESLTTFIALIKNAETMIDQESDTESEDDRKVLLKYTTERMFMTYVLKEFGNTSSLNKFYDKVKATIPAKEMDYDDENKYTKKLDVLEKTRMVFKRDEYNLNSPYKKDAFSYALAGKFNLTKVKDENGKIINIKANAENRFADCADTATRHLINLLSYDKENGWNYIYDETDEEEVKKLDAISNKVLGAINNNQEINYDNLEDRLKAFYYYQNRLGVDNANTFEGHTFWNYVISNMNALQGEGSQYYNLDYNQGNNELLPGYINFLKLAYNIAYALKAGKALKTANGTDYDGEQGQLMKAKNAIDALLGDNYQKSIEELNPLLQTAITAVFSLYNKGLRNVKFAGLMKGGRAGNDIVQNGGFTDLSEFKISRTQNSVDNLNFKMSIMDGHAETHHTPHVNELTPEEKYKAFDANPRLTLLPDLNSYFYERNLPLFERLFSYAPRGVIDEDVNDSSLYDKIALQNMMNIIDDEGIISTIDKGRILKLIFDSEESIKINRLNKVKDKNGKDIEIPEEPTNIAEYLRSKFVKTIKQNNESILGLIKPINQLSKNILEIPKYKSMIDEIFEGANNIYKDGEDYYRYTLEDNKLKITEVLTKDGNIKPPKEFEIGGNKYSVESINLGFNSRLVSVEIPDSVTTIESHGFCKCKNLERITIPNSVKFIGNFAFEDCNKLVEINLPHGLGFIGRWIFSGCTSLTNIQIPETVGSIEKGAFCGCKGLKNVNIPYGLTEISSGVFNGCSSLKSITLPNSVISIEEGTFYNCTGLESINIPYGLTEISSGVFDGCSNLRSITLPNSVVSIKESAFNNCTGLESINIPNELTEISSKVFCGCRSLKSITIPNSVESIEDSAFAGCSLLRVVNISKNITKIGERAFADCRSLGDIVIPEGVTRIEEYTFRNSSVESIIIPDSVRMIEESAFIGCDVNKIELPLRIMERMKWCNDMHGSYPIHLNEYIVKRLRKGRVRLTKKNN